MHPILKTMLEAQETEYYPPAPMPTKAASAPLSKIVTPPSPKRPQDRPIPEIKPGMTVKITSDNTVGMVVRWDKPFGMWRIRFPSSSYERPCDAANLIPLTPDNATCSTAPVWLSNQTIFTDNLLSIATQAIPFTVTTWLIVHRPTAKQELEAILGKELDDTSPQRLPNDIGEAATHIGIDPSAANHEDWQKVLQYLLEQSNYHLLRSRPDWIQTIVDKQAHMHTTEGWAFDKWQKMRKGAAGKNGRQQIKDAMKPADMTWAQFYKEQEKFANAYLDLADELDDILN